MYERREEGFLRETPSFAEKNFRHSSKSFRRKPVRRSLQKPKRASQKVLENRKGKLEALLETKKNDSFVKEKKKEEKPKIKKQPESIVPSESYAKMVGLTASMNSSGLPLLRKPLSKSVQPTLSDSKIERLKKSRLKRPKRFRKSKQDGQSSGDLLKARSDRLRKYGRLNSMSLTPDVKSDSPKLPTKRTATPQLKKLKAPSSLKMSIPFIKAAVKNRKFTLVLDLDETLIHFKNIPGKSKFLIRPHCYKFLRNLHSQFEIIIFTAAQQQYADWIIDKIDQKVV